MKVTVVVTTPFRLKRMDRWEKYVKGEQEVHPDVATHMLRQKWGYAKNLMEKKEHKSLKDKLEDK